LRAARSRAHAAPILGIVIMRDTNRNIWLQCAHPPDAPVMRARRPARSLWDIVSGTPEIYSTRKYLREKWMYNFQFTIYSLEYK
jgi:hypothetical protein